MILGLYALKGQRNGLITVSLIFGQLLITNAIPFKIGNLYTGNISYSFRNTE